MRLRPKKGLETKIPPPSESVLGDAGHMRSDLAKYGFGFDLFSLNSVAQDLRSLMETNPQAYKGQKPTFTTNNFLNIFYDLGQENVDNGQFVVGFVNTEVSWEPAGPTSDFQFYKLEYNQSLLNDKLKFSVGIFSNDIKFIGITVGGSLAGGTQGSAATIPFELGLSYVPVGAPGFNASYTYHHFYDKFGLQRSIDPDGIDGDDPLRSLRFNLPHTGLLLIDEIGYKRQASADHSYLWARMGYIYNTSDYQEFNDDRRANDNHAIFALVDYQVLPFGRALALDGIYFGASYYKAPEDRNLFDEVVSTRLYAKGLFPSRPLDQISLVYKHTGYSDTASDMYGALGATTFNGSSGYVLSYSARLSPGLYLSTGLGYTTHPAFSPRLDDAFNALANLNIFF